MRTTGQSRFIHMKFEYPLKVINDENATNYMGANNRLGFYPIGRLNAWHGGIHLEAFEKVRAIADGKVIAYRLTMRYIEEPLEDKTYQYSNNFVLVQHDYKSPNGLEMKFYSLYMHLMSIDETGCENDYQAPRIFAKEVYKVRMKKGVEGLRLRSCSNEEKDTEGKNPGKEEGIVPFGAKVTANLQFTEDEKSTTHWTKTGSRKGQYLKVTAKIPGKAGMLDGYIYLKSLKKTGNDYLINSKEDKDNSILGAYEFAKPDTKSEILRIIPFGTEIGIVKEKDGKWGKVIYKKDKPAGDIGYIEVDQVEVENRYDHSKIKLDKVVSCDIPVKAGEVIGYTGLYGFEKFPGYRVVHFEVFTDGDVNKFLKDEVESEKRFLKVEKDLRLKKAFSYKLLKDTYVKVLNRKEKFTQVEVGGVARLVMKEDLGKYVGSQDTKNPRYYLINEGKGLDALNRSFDDLLSKNDKLYLHCNKIAELQSKGKDPKVDDRLVRYEYPIKGKKIWVASSVIPKEEPAKAKVTAIKPHVQVQPSASVVEGSTVNEAPSTVAVIANDTVAVLPATAVQAIVTKPVSEAPNVNSSSSTSVEEPYKHEEVVPEGFVKLLDEVTEIYMDEPEPKEGTTDQQMPEEATIRISDLQKMKDQKGQDWLEVKYSRTEGSGLKEYKGWVKENDPKLKKISAYNWEAFGFSVVDDKQDEYLYDVDAPPTFLKDVWNRLDKDGNKVISSQEMRYAFGNRELVEKISKLVCKHTSEWSYNTKWSSFKEKVKALYQHGIDDEEDVQLKQELIQKRDLRLRALEARLNNLCWWGKVQPTAVVEPKKEVKKEELNKDNNLAPTQKSMDWFSFDYWYEYFFGPKDAPKPPEAEKIDTQKLKAMKEAEEKAIQNTTRSFPTGTPKVYHFHPIAFVRQMRMR